MRAPHKHFSIALARAHHPVGMTEQDALHLERSETDVIAFVGAIAAVALGVLSGVELHRWLIGAERRAHAITRRVRPPVA
jgi:hypothetical protein